MDKYIKESDLFKRILNVDFKHDYDGCIKFCQSIPAADVQEVWHGRWKIIKCPTGVEAFGYKEMTVQSLMCSNCSYEIDVSEGYFEYCPNCGSFMDLEYEEE